MVLTLGGLAFEGVSLYVLTGTNPDIKANTNRQNIPQTFYGSFI